MGGRGGGSSIASRAAAPSAASVAPGSSGESIIREIYDTLNRSLRNVAGLDVGNIDMVHVSQIRQRLSDLGWSREKQDTEFRKLAVARKVVFIPQANQKILKQSERDGAFRLGNEDKHLITFK